MSELVEWLMNGPRRIRALVIGGGSVLALLFVGVFIAIYGYIYIGFSQPFTALLISAFGALSTILLVMVTFATFVENQLHTAKEREKPLVRDKLREIVIPFRNVLEENRKRLLKESVDWHRLSGQKVRFYSNPPRNDLKPLLNRAKIDTIVLEQFFQEHHELRKPVITHDEVLERLAEQACRLVSRLAEPLDEYIANNDIEVRDGELAQGEIIAVFILNQEDDPGAMNTHQGVWLENDEKFQRIAKDVADDKIDNFFEMRQRYIDHSNELDEKLHSIRKELQSKYNISIEDDEKGEDNWHNFWDKE